MTLTVRAHETGVVRIFALSMDTTQAADLRDDAAAQKAALGATYIDPDFTEVFPVSDLGDLGLAGYLSTGNGIPATQLDPDRTKLAALDGWVLLAFSNAFGDFAQTLKPASNLTHIGTYAEDGIDWSPVEIETEATDLYTGPTVDPAPVQNRKTPTALIALIAAIIGLMIFALLQ